MTNATVTKTRKTRGATRPLHLRLQEAIDTEKAKVEYHKKHLSNSQTELARLEKVLKEHNEQEVATASERLAEIEAEAERLKKLLKK